MCVCVCVCVHVTSYFIYKKIFSTCLSYAIILFDLNSNICNL